MALPRHITFWEFDELVVELEARPKLWMGKQRLWVRRRYGENQLAVKFVEVEAPQGLMLQPYVKPLNEEQTQEEAERYVEWLLKKMTTFGERTRIEQLLIERCPELPVEKVQEVVLDIMRPLEALEAKIRVVKEQQAPQATQATQATQAPISPIAVTPTPPPKTTIIPDLSSSVKRSRYLQNLLRKSKQ